MRKYWLFDVSHCTAAELQSSYEVTVQFERATRYTLSNTIDRRAVAQTKELVSSNRCQVVGDESGSQIFSCLPETGTREERNAKLVDNTATR